MTPAGLLLVVLLVATSNASSDYPSIMELINSNHVQSVGNNTQPTKDDGYLMMDKKPAGNSIIKHRKKQKTTTNLPHFSAVLSKLLKPDDTTQLVGRREIIRKDWCKSGPIIQIIREEGCLPRNVVNRFCYGQCNSFYVPRDLGPRTNHRKREEEDSQSFRSCGVCKPRRTSWIHVNLNCPGSTPPVRRRRLLKIKQCLCMADNTSF